MAAPLKGIPDNSAIVIPRLVCGDPAGEVAFCEQTFHAVAINQRPGPDGKLAHALLTLGTPRSDAERPTMLMIESEWPTLPSRRPAADGSSAVVIFVYVEDVDATVASATALGATVLFAPQNQFWGDRIAWIMDPNGHVWTIASRIEETTAEQRTDRWSSILKSESGGQ